MIKVEVDKLCTPGTHPGVFQGASNNNAKDLWQPSVPMGQRTKVLLDEKKHLLDN